MGDCPLPHLAAGTSEVELLDDFPQLKAEHIRAVFAYAAEREQRLSETQVG